jgi:HEAT repeat-containing protein 5
MQAGDPTILASMDGRESSTASKNTAPATVRDEPTVFFFVIFGLIYEALATSSTESNLATSNREPTVIAALQALKSLVRPEYSGKALLEPTTFDEFISLCYRMAMTETASIQIHLVGVIAALATSQNKKTNGNMEYVLVFSCFI